MFEFSPLLAVETADQGGMIQQIADQMGVNWPQLLSQIFLFILVLLTLKKFAFGPVQTVLDERQKVIEQTLENAEKIRLELAAAEASRKEILKKAEAQAAEMIKQAQASAENLAARRLAEAAKEADQLVVKTRAGLQIEQARMETELRQQFTRLVAEATQRVTGKILTPEDHQRLNTETLTQVSRN